MEIGDVIAGRYQLLGRLGRGGMGEVFRALDRSLERQVAVKVLPAHLLGDESANRRFRREAQLAASLSHSNVIMVHDVVQEGDAQALVMELVDGPTLADVVQAQGPMPWRRALTITAAVADGLEAAHRKGLIHRDIKPSNVLLAEDETPKVTDFGIARATTASQTMTSTVQGSAPYLAPEQARGEQTDARTDIYSLGCVLYELVSGRPPFMADDAVAIVYQHLHTDPAPPSALVSQVPPNVDDVVLTALARDPAARPPSAAAFAAALRRVLAGEAPGFTPPPATTRVIPPEPPRSMPPATPTPTPAPRRPPPDDGREPRRSSVLPLFVTLGLVAVATMLLISVFADDPNASEEPAAETGTEQEAPATEDEAPPAEEPAPEPDTEQPAEPATGTEGTAVGGGVLDAASGVIDAVADAGRAGQLGANAALELGQTAAEVVGEVQSGDPGAALNSVDELRARLETASEEGQASQDAVSQITDALDQLRSAIGG